MPELMDLELNELVSLVSEIDYESGDFQLLQRAAISLHGELRVQLEQLLTADEIDALEMRVNRLLNQGCFPHPSPDWPAVPWPAF